MRESIRSKGMRDMLPAEMERFRRIEKAFRDVALGWGYQEVRTPTIEHLYLFTSAGTLSPQMLERVYSFLDWDGWSGERVVLRPDSTIPAARLFVESMGDVDTAKLFYVQNVLRFDPGDDSREDWQCGVELFGDSFPRGDVELILMAREVLDRIGVTADITLSHPGIVRSVLEKAGLDHSEQMSVYGRVLEGDLTPLTEIEGRLPGSASVRSLLATEGEGPEYLANLATVLGGDIPGVATSVGELRAISATLTDMGMPHRIAPLGVRSFEYYTGPMFSLACGDQRVGGGGRYDALVGLVGGGDVPASGFALEMEVLSELLPVDVSDAGAITIRCETPEALGRAFTLARALRDGETLVQVVTDGASTGRDVLVSENSYTLELNGGEPKSLHEVNDVVRSLAGS